MPQDLFARVEALLRSLGLHRAADRLADTLPADPKRRAIALDAFEAVLQDQLNQKIERRVQRRIEEARFPDMLLRCMTSDTDQGASLHIGWHDAGIATGSARGARAGS